MLIRLGLISDTHGLLRPEAVQVLRGSNLIVHAGDVGSRLILDALRVLAPLVAVRGNVDRGDWADMLPETDMVSVGGMKLYVLHDVQALDLDPGACGFDAVVSGHSHKPLIERRRGVLFLNPGSAGPRRFKLPVTVARATIESGRIDAEIVRLDRGAEFQDGTHV
jgi:putative phosphoesterase